MVELRAVSEAPGTDELYFTDWVCARLRASMMTTAMKEWKVALTTELSSWAPLMGDPRTQSRPKDSGPAARRPWRRPPPPRGGLRRGSAGGVDCAVANRDALLSLS